MPPALLPACYLDSLHVAAFVDEYSGCSLWLKSVDLEGANGERAPLVDELGSIDKEKDGGQGKSGAACKSERPVAW